ncbi:MAG: HAMP domain-containing protein, partial [Chloroflexales bacterium]|nr:HAMP domain-containing protein [Chloroflexales bacterium]
MPPRPRCSRPSGASAIGSAASAKAHRRPRMPSNRPRAAPTPARTFTPVWLGLGLGLALVVLLAVVWLQAPAADLAALLTSLLITGLASVGLGLAGMGWLRRGHVRIWLQVTLTYLFGVAVALCNILVTAQLMFISSHDLPLLALLMLFAALIATGLGAALSHVFAERVSALHQGAAALATGDLTARVPVAGHDELAALARTFNHMADQLAAG